MNRNDLPHHSSRPYRLPRIGRIGSLLIATTLFLSASIAQSYNISGVSVLPADPINAGSQVSVDIHLWSPAPSIYLWNPTEVNASGTTIDITVYSTTTCLTASPGPLGCATVIDSLQENVLLGPLGAGIYTVNIETIVVDYFGATSTGDTEQTMFTVVPEPSAALLIGLGLTWVSGARRRD